MFAATQNPLPSLLLIWALFGTVIGLGTRAVMIGKGRSGASGFWLGFFLGLLGLLIAALQSPTPEHEFRKQQLMSMMGAAQGLPMHMTQAGPLAHAAQWADVQRERQQQDRRDMVAASQGGRCHKYRKPIAVLAVAAVSACASTTSGRDEMSSTSPGVTGPAAVLATEPAAVVANEPASEPLSSVVSELTVSSRDGSDIQNLRDLLSYDSYFERLVFEVEGRIVVTGGDKGSTIVIDGQSASVMHGLALPSGQLLRPGPGSYDGIPGSVRVDVSSIVNPSRVTTTLQLNAPPTAEFGEDPITLLSDGNVLVRFQSESNRNVAASNSDQGSSGTGPLDSSQTDQNEATSDTLFPSEQAARWVVFSSDLQPVTQGVGRAGEFLRVTVANTDLRPFQQLWGPVLHPDALNCFYDLRPANDLCGSGGWPEGGEASFHVISLTNGFAWMFPYNSGQSPDVRGVAGDRVGAHIRNSTGYDDYSLFVMFDNTGSELWRSDDSTILVVDGHVFTTGISVKELDPATGAILDVLPLDGQLFNGPAPVTENGPYITTAEGELLAAEFKVPVLVTDNAVVVAVGPRLEGQDLYNFLGQQSLRYVIIAK